MADIFTDAQIDEIMRLINDRAGTNRYVGARYVPIFGRKDEDTIEWDNSKPYEPLTIVLHQGNSYTSRQYVPTGIDIGNESFWANTGNYNAQVEAYRREVLGIVSEVREYEASTSAKIVEFEGDLGAVRTLAEEGKALAQSDAAAIDVLAGNTGVSSTVAGTPSLADRLTTADGDIDMLFSNTGVLRTGAEPKSLKQAQEDMQADIDRWIAEFDAVRAEITAGDAELLATVNEINRRSVKNVIAFGAVGDGLTDDSDAFNAAIRGGGFVLVPPGRYRIGKALELESNLHISGYGAVLYGDPVPEYGTGIDVFRFRSYDPNTRLRHCKVEGFEITGTNDEDKNVWGVHIFQEATIAQTVIDDVILDHLYIHDIPGRGINTFGGPSGSGWSGHGSPIVYIQNCFINNTGSWGICNSATSPRVFNCIVSNAGTETMSVDNGCTNAFVMNSRFYNARGGAGCVSVDELNTAYFTNCTFNQPDSQRPAFRANNSSGNVLHLIMMGNFFYGGTYGISIGWNNRFYTQCMLSNNRCTGSANGFYSGNDNDYIVSGGNNWFSPMNATNKNSFASKVHTTADSNSIF